jgi:hypothetical protein
MKRILFLVFCAFSLGACNVDEPALDNPDSLIGNLNATYTINGCVVTTFDYGTMGFIQVRNDRDNLYISVFAEGDNIISATSLHIADNFSMFPTVGKGNLQPKEMEYQKFYEVGVKQESFTFPLSDFGGTMVIASYTTFNGAESLWAGEIAIKQGNWSYFEYQVKEHPVNAGLDNSRTMTVSEATALPSWDEVRKVYAGMLAAGVDRKSGTYNPSIWDIINDFNDPKRESKIGQYTTKYTLGSGDCTDTVVLTLDIVPDLEESFN